MKKAMRIPVIVLAVLGLLAADGTFAADTRIYDPKTVETATGEVLQVKKIPHRRGSGYGVHLILKTETEEIPVHLGPSRYLDKQAVKIDGNDKVVVKGSRVTTKRGKPFLLAAEVRKGEAVLKLRDENGVPAWNRRKTR